MENENATINILLQDFVQMETDRQYVHGMYRTVFARLFENPTNLTYYYRFDYDAQKLNGRKIQYCGTTDCNKVSAMPKI